MRVDKLKMNRKLHRLTMADKVKISGGFVNPAHITVMIFLPDIIYVYVGGLEKPLIYTRKKLPTDFFLWALKNEVCAYGAKTIVRKKKEVRSCLQ